jgi:hypothetical protein
MAAPLAQIGFIFTTTVLALASLPPDGCAAG